MINAQQPHLPRINSKRLKSKVTTIKWDLILNYDKENNFVLLLLLLLLLLIKLI